MKRNRRFTKEDLDVWHRVRASVRPMHESLSKRIHDHFENELETHIKDHTNALNAPIPHLKRSESQIKIDLKKTPPLADVKGMQRSTQRALSKGRLEPEAKLDLHGMRLESAEIRFRNFIKNAALQKQKLVLVVTGKGGHKRLSDFGHEVSGVIRRAFPEWMNSAEIAPLVSHYTQAHAKHGGDGAWYVFIAAAARR